MLASWVYHCFKTFEHFVQMNVKWAISVHKCEEYVKSLPVLHTCIGSLMLYFASYQSYCCINKFFILFTVAFFSFFFYLCHSPLQRLCCTPAKNGNTLSDNYMQPTTHPHCPHCRTFMSYGLLLDYKMSIVHRNLIVKPLLEKMTTSPEENWSK